VKLFLDSESRQLFTATGRVFSLQDRRWKSLKKGPSKGEEVTLIEAVNWLQFDSGYPCRAPVAVIGRREAEPEQLAIAEDIGSRLARMNLSLLCGGRQGIMEAACRGAAKSGGISVGLLPDADPSFANPYVTVPISTGLGIARNSIIACAGLCLIAVGGGYGTISEVAFGLQFNKNVFVLADGPEIKGVHLCDNVNQVMDGVALTILGLPVTF
jgi:uncharacterized protein (TIGR00725 family)